MPQGALGFLVFWACALAAGVLIALLATGASWAWLMLAVIPAALLLLARRRKPGSAQVPEQRDIER